MRGSQRRTRGPRRRAALAITAGSGLAAVATLLSGALGEAAGTAPTVTVKTLGDTASPAAGNVHNHHAPTLADAIAYLNKQPGGGTITFASQLSGTIELTSKLPFIKKPIDVQGPGASKLRIRNQVAAWPDFTVYSASSRPSEISGVTLTGGQIGAIYAISPLIVSHATITHNTTPFGGAGVAELGSALTVDNSKVTENTVSGTTGFGGGILAYGTARAPGQLTITDSTITANTAPLGGGVNAIGSATTVIDGSTISGNTATVDAGGIDVESKSKPKGPTAFIENSTIADNVTHGYGGGIYLGDKGEGGATNMTILGSTITGNLAKHGPGGGIVDRGGTIKLDDSILAANRDTSTGGQASPDLAILKTDRQGKVIAKFSLIGDGAQTITRTLHANLTDRTGTAKGHLDPRLHKLAPNGGPTTTMAPKNGSPTLGTGNAELFTNAIPGLTFNVDQRNGERVGLGGGARTSDGTDIGAVERTRIAQVRTFTKGNQRFTLSTAAEDFRVKPTAGLPFRYTSSPLRGGRPTLFFRELKLTLSGSPRTLRLPFPSGRAKLGLQGLKAGRHTLTAAITYDFKVHGHTDTFTKRLRLRVEIS